MYSDKINKKLGPVWALGSVTGATGNLEPGANAGS